MIATSLKRLLKSRVLIMGLVVEMPMNNRVVAVIVDGSSIKLSAKVSKIALMNASIGFLKSD